MAKISFRSYALSDQGVRSNNEDLVHNDDERGIYFVVDGMGGHAAGEHAAQIAGERLRGRLERATGSPQQRIREAIALANNAIFETAAQHPDWNGMACVLTVALVADGTATVGHVGDSRLYKIRGDAVDKITRDHSPVGELEDSKQLSEAEAMAHPRRNEVYRDVGLTLHDPNDKDFIDVYEISAEPDSTLLLCSDGLTDAVPLADIRRIVRANAKNPANAARALIDQAKKEQGKDNISVVLVQGAGLGGGIGAGAPVKEMVAPQAVMAPTVFIERRSPLWQRVIWAVVWMAVGVVLFWGVPQLVPRPAKHVVPPGITSTPFIHVDPGNPSAKPTITAALSDTREGLLIQVAPGVYDEAITISKRRIVIDGGGAVLRPKATNEGSDGITIAGGADVVISNLRIAGDADGDLVTGIHIVDSHVTLQNVHVDGAAGPGIETGGSSTLKMEASSVRDSSGPGLLLRGAVNATVKYSAIIGNGRDAGDHQPGMMIESSQPVALVGNIFANNGGGAITQPGLPTKEMLGENLFSLDGRKGRLDDVHVIRNVARKRANK